MPKTQPLGRLADQRYKLREQRAALNQKLAELKEKEDALEADIFHALRESETTSATGALAVVSIKREDVPQMEDFDAFFAFAKRKGNSDLLAQRVSTTAWRERIRNGKDVPGVKSFTRVSLSITKKRK